MFCKKCGQNIGDAQFCPHCGASQSDTEVKKEKATERWETTTRTVSPSRESAVTKKFEHFGWELMSSQTIDQKDSHLESRDGDLYSVTESTNYVKLTFRRNKNMQHYNELVELENELKKLVNDRDENLDLEDYETSHDLKNPKWSIFIKIGLAYLTGLGIMSLMQGADSGNMLYKIGGIAIIAGVILLILRHGKKVTAYEAQEATNNLNYEAAVEKAEEELSRKRKEIYAKAESLLSMN